MLIKILGTGCPNCVRLEANVKVALEKAGIKSNVEKITDIADIMSYSIMGTPGLVIDEKVVSAGKVCDVEEIITLLNGNNELKQEKKSCGCSCNGKC
ncbi:MAG: thioredoxin family protein [Candidatus Gracilibacteria bacterium]|nr:thioredoxin family protein [Candidatus Gracilibacteria bacterium]